MVVLVVGANGQLGARCCAELLGRGHAVRGSVRALERGRSLAEAGVELVEADLASPEGLSAACDGVDTVILTANAVVPRAGDDQTAVQRGILRLVDDAASAGVRRVVVTSLPRTPVDEQLPLARWRRELEQRLASASFEHVILRLPPFMEAWLALVGSSIPLRDEPFATIGRPSPFLRRFRGLTGTLVEDRGLMLVPGSAATRNAFIGIRDVAIACAEAVGRPDAANRTFEVGGPEVLTWTEVAAIFERILHRRVRILSTPAAVYAVAAKVLAPVGQVPSATMALNRLVAVAETPWTPGGGGLVDPAGMVTVSQFLETKAALPASLPTVL